MRRAPALLVAATVLAVGAVAACSPDEERVDAESTSESAATATAAEASGATDGDSSPAATDDSPAFDAESACSGFSDVLTIVANAKAGLADGRMAEQERDGWFHLATRVLARLPSDGPDAVALSIAHLQEVAPAPVSTFYATEVDTQEWVEATMAVSSACEAAGFEPPTSMFTGG